MVLVEKMELVNAIKVGVVVIARLLFAIMNALIMVNVNLVSASAMINGLELIVQKNLVLLIAIIREFAKKVFAIVKINFSENTVKLKVAKIIALKMENVF